MAKVELKQPIVQEIADQIDGAQSVVVGRLPWTYRICRTHSLRKELREAGVSYKVYKNTYDEFRIQRH